MTATLPPVVSRLAALVLLFLLFGAGMLAVAPVFDYSHKLAAERERLVDWLQRYRAVRADTAAVNTRFAELERIRERQQSAWLAGDTPALAAVALQERVKQVATAAGAELTSTRIMPEERSDGLTRIAVTVDLQTRIGALRAMLHEIESGRPSLFVDALDIVRQVMIGTLEPGADDPMLSVRMQISGYKAEPAAAPGTGTIATGN